MIKKYFCLFLFLGFVINSSRAYSQIEATNYTTYVAPTVILLKPYSKNLKMLVPSASHVGYTLGMHGGLSYDQRLFLELDCSYQHANLCKDHRQNHQVKKNFYQSWNCIINNVYYFSPVDCLSPYLGLGIGYRGSKITIYRYTLDYSLHSKGEFFDHAPAYQFFGGFKCTLFEKTDIAIEGLLRHGVKKTFILGIQLGLSLTHRF